MADIEQPTLKRDTGKEQHYTHPAYGCITATRSNGRMNLFECKVNGDGFVSLKITEAELIHGEYTDRMFGHGKAIIEVVMSEAQWVAFVSRMNIGDGTACTFRYVRDGNLVDVPSLPPQETAAERLAKTAVGYGDAVENTVKKDIAKLRELLEGLPKKKAEEVNRVIEMIERRTYADLQYGKKVLNDHAEKLVSAAGIEIGAKLSATLTQLGIRSAQHLAAISDAAEGRDDTLSLGNDQA